MTRTGPRAPKGNAVSVAEEGREAYGRKDWEDAYRLLSQADEAAPLVVDDLELLAWTAGLTGRDGDFLKVFERLYQAHLGTGEQQCAARSAFWLGLRLFALGEAGRATGWLGRAERLVADHDWVERGYLLLPVVRRHIGAGAYEAACDSASRAIEIGLRFDDADLASFARNLLGQALLRQGRIAEGLVLLDEAMLATTTGDLSPIFTGLIYCSVIESCQEVFALDRCREWTSALAAWCDSQPQLVIFTSACLVHRAEIMQLNGEWNEAIKEARRASERFSDATDSEAVAAGFYQQAEVHRLRGAFGAAEAAYQNSSRFGGDAQPGLSLLRLAQGKVEAAAATIRRVLGATEGRTHRTRLLPAYVEIMLASGELGDARVACIELETAAADFDTEIVSAMAAHARGAVQLAEGDPKGAFTSLHRAFIVWQRFGAPYLAARLRLQIGLACRALGDSDGAALEISAARATFAELGATPDVSRVDALVGSDSSDRPHRLTPRELQVLRLVAEGKTNRSIAAELDVSEKTVDRHVSNIFNKIDVPSRAAATAYAYEHKLV